MIRFRKHFPLIALASACVITFLLWLQTAHLPVVSDTSLYAILGESFWTKGQYAVLGEIHGKHMPFHAITSYPFVLAFGYSLGMKLVTLVWGIGILIAAFFLIKRTMGERIAGWTVLAIALHHGFSVMTQLGSADPLLTLLFLLSLHTYLSAEKNPRTYLLMGLFLGFACLTRYNPAPLFLFLPAYTCWKRRKDVLSPWFIGGLLLAAFLFSLWFIRAYLVFGHLQNDYTDEFQVKSVGLIGQFITNLKYYSNPLRNILPILFAFSLYGVWRGRKQYVFLLFFMIGIWSLFAVWPVLNIRYAFPGYIFLLAFAVYGIFEAAKSMERFRSAFLITVLFLTLASDLGALCLYGSGACNTLWDRTIDRIPKNLGLATEGFYTWDIARAWVNAHADASATVRAEGIYNATVQAHGTYRDDLQVVADKSDTCPVYDITQNPGKMPIVFQTEDQPVTYVTKEECKK